MRPMLLLILVLAASRAAGATFTVSNTQDAGPGSLRQAILDANTQAGPDTLNCTGVSGAITLLSALPVLSSEITISGPGPSLLTVTRDSNVFIRIFEVTGNVSIWGLKVYAGWINAADGATAMGGGILSSGDLALHNVLVDECYVFGFTGIATGAGFAAGGGIAATAGSLSLTDVRFEDCVVQAATNGASSAAGGGVYSSGVTHSFLRVECERCEARNYPSSPVAWVNGCACDLSGGGTIHDFYAYTCANSPGDQGAVLMLHEQFEVDRFSVYLSGSACLGLSANTSGAILRNGTIRGSMQADHAIFCTGTAPPEFYYCTIYDNYQNQEALFASGVTPSLRSCIVAANGVRGDIAGSYVDLGFNLIGDAGSASGFSVSTLIGSAASPIDPLLSPLVVQRHGQVSYCFLPLPGSPALDAGGPVSGVILDQDNLPRRVDNAALPNTGGGDGSDIGAVEQDVIQIEVSRPPQAALAQGGTDTIAPIVPTLQGTTLDYEITNTGSLAVTFPAAAISLSLFVNCTATVVTQPPAGDLAPAATSVVRVVLTPLAIGAFTAHVSLSSNAATAPFEWNIGGNADNTTLSITRGVAISAGGTDLIAGSVAGTFDLTYTLSNTGLGALFFMGATPIYCDNAVNCSAVIVSAPAMIAPGNTASMVVRITPATAGLFSAQVHLISNDPLNPAFTFTLAGASVPEQSTSNEDAACSSSEQNMPAIALLAFMLFATLRLRSRVR